MSIKKIVGQFRSLPTEEVKIGFIAAFLALAWDGEIPELPKELIDEIFEMILTGAHPVEIISIIIHHKPSED